MLLEYYLSNRQSPWKLSRISWLILVMAWVIGGRWIKSSALVRMLRVKSSRPLPWVFATELILQKSPIKDERAYLKSFVAFNLPSWLVMS